jgi:hypothetical protein
MRLSAGCSEIRIGDFVASSYPRPPSKVNAKGIACRGSFRSFVHSSHPSSCSRLANWSGRGRLSVVSGSEPVWFCYFTRTQRFPTRTRPVPWGSRTSGFGSGVAGGTMATSPSRIGRVQDGRLAFPPTEQSQVKAVACEIVAETKVPLSRQSTTDVTNRVSAALERPISRSTV